MRCIPTLPIKLAALMEMTDRDGYEMPMEGVEAGQAGGRGAKRAELGANV